MFPDADTLMLALAGSIVGPDVTLAPATLTIDAQGRLYVEPDTDLSTATRKNLDRIGAKGSRRHGSTVKERVATWLQIIPLVKDPAQPTLASQTPVLFELESADDLPLLVSEMLRLGNDKQSFRWFDAEDGTNRVLLRVLGPPYYTLLRAIDRTASGTKGAVRAYLEPTPSVWIEIGFTHPFATQIKAPEGQLLLLRSPRHWLVLDESPFQDAYDLLEFDLPKVPVGWNETQPLEKIEVPLKLAAGNAADVAELWVLRTSAFEQLDAFVRDADATLAQRLTFAVASDAEGKKVIVLRTRPSKLPPPVLPFENALGFKPFWKLPNLFLPVGRRLHPTLRRDAVRRLLADDPDRVVWLHPGSAGEFTPESVPDSAFRPLEDWVEYIIETNQQPLKEWIEASRFDFDSFICSESPGPKPKPPETELEVREPAAQAKVSPDAAPKAVKPRVKPTAPAKAELAPLPEVQPPSAWRIQRESLEERFLAVEGPLDSPERMAMWPELAEANAGEGSLTEAGLCWLNAMWSANGSAGASPSRWFRAEFPSGTLDAKEFDRRLANRKPSVEDLRSTVAGFLWLSYQDPVPAWLPERLPAVQQFFETNEGSIPVRSVWLVALRQAKLAGADVLGLARVRDRLVFRLQEEGLRAERDLPLFLRYAGLKDSARLRVARDKALELHQIARRWSAAIPVNLPFIDLFFSFALARLGESVASKELLDEARGALEVLEASSQTPGFANSFFLPAFEYRIEQACLDKVHRGPFPKVVVEKTDRIRRLKEEFDARNRDPDSLEREIKRLKDEHAEIEARKIVNAHGKQATIKLDPEETARLAEIERELKPLQARLDAKRGGRSANSNPYWEALSVVDRMRQESRILEPIEAPQPYRSAFAYDDPRQTELLHLTDFSDPAELSMRIRRLDRYRINSKTPKEWRCRVLHQALPLAPRIGEQFALELLKLVPDAITREGLTVGNPPTLGELTKIRGEIIDRALVLAAQYGQTDYVQKLATQFADLIRTEPEESRHLFIDVAMGQCLRNLKKLGMRDQIDRLLARVQSLVFPTGTVEDLREKHTRADSWARTLQSLLHLAGGWLMLGQNSRANEVLDAARAELLAPKSKFLPKDFTDLAQAYIAAVGHGSSEAGIERIKEFFAKVPASAIPNNWTGSQTYSRLHLKLIEEVVHAVTSDEFALGPAGRRWLDEDEYHVRNRIHADLNRLRAQSGV